jgi:O-antigen/teichoic acid export membrane protein
MHEITTIETTPSDMTRGGMTADEASRGMRLRGMFPWLSGASWGQIKEYAPTFVTEFAVMASQIITYKLAAYYLGKQGFSEYALARRTVSLIFPIPVLGLAVGLPRYIGFSNGRNDPESAARYYGATLWCAGCAAVVCVVLLNLFAATFGYLFFGDRGYGSFARPLSLMILGLCIHTVVCGYLRGHMHLNRANLLQFLNLALAPTCVFFFARHSLGGVLTSLGLVWTVTAGAALLLTPWQAMLQNTRKEIRELLQYGLQRVPGDFILMALFTLPATFIAHARGVQEAGFVAFGISVVSMVGAIFSPVGLVLLPKATSMLAEGANKNLREHVRFIIRLTIAASIGIVFIVWVSIPTLIRVYLGANFGQVVPIVRILILGALPYSLYLVVRNLVDAYHEYGVTAAILAVGLVVLLAGSFASRHFGFDTHVILSGFLLAQVVIAALSSWECRRILRT